MLSSLNKDIIIIIIIIIIMTVRPAKTQISLDIRPVWSESSLCA